MSISTTQNITALGDLKQRIGSTLSSTFEGWGTYLRKRRAYRTTLIELAELSDRELADLGFSRGDIRRVAREATEMV